MGMHHQAERDKPQTYNEYVSFSGFRVSVS